MAATLEAAALATASDACWLRRASGLRWAQKPEEPPKHSAASEWVRFSSRNSAKSTDRKSTLLGWSGFPPRASLLFLST